MLEEGPPPAQARPTQKVRFYDTTMTRSARRVALNKAL
jgi:hypothetical protein